MTRIRALYHHGDLRRKSGKTQVVMHDLYPWKEALDAAIASESTGGFIEQFGQLDELLVTGASAGRPES